MRKKVHRQLVYEDVKIYSREEWDKIKEKELKQKKDANNHCSK